MLEFTASLCTAEECTAAFAPHFERARSIFETLRSNSNAEARDVLEHYNELFRHIDFIQSASSLLSNVHPNEGVRKIAEKYEQDCGELVTEISLSPDLYKIFKNCDSEGLDAEEVRLLNKILLDFKRSGASTDPETREKIKQLRAELVQIGQAFDRNVREDVHTIELHVGDLAGLPDDFIEAHKPSAAGIIQITTDYPDVRPFMVYANNGIARQKLYREFNRRAFPKNSEVLNSMLKKRFELAQLLGYAHWADYVTEDKMIKTAVNAHKFLEKITEISAPRAAADYEVLLERKKIDEPDASNVFAWEKAYYEELIKREQFAFNSQDVRPYFEYAGVKKGLMNLAAELFNINFTAATAAPVWHSSVEVFDVDRGGVPLGRIYLDMHPRENKYKHAAQFTLRSGVRDVQLPEGVLVCNFTNPHASTTVALLDHDQVTTFFHEFGHLLHHILGGAQKWIYFSGVATEWDFVEAPSQFFEEWAWNTEVLARFARHYQTEEPIPAALVEKMRAADEFGKGLHVRRQMMLANISLEFYNRSAQFDPHALYNEIYERFNPFPFEPDTYMELSFGHLDGYSAIYYTYMWSFVIAKDLLSKFLEHGMMNTNVAGDYARIILEPGGSADAADLIKNFLGRDYSFDAFAAWLAPHY